MRIILLFIAVITLFWVVKRLFFAPNKNCLNNSQTSKRQQGEILVECAHCKIHIPKSEAIKIDKHYFCCKQHAEKR